MELALLDFDNTLTNSSSIVLKETILDIKKYTIDNKICIISNSSFNFLNEFKNNNLLNISFYSIKDSMGILDDKIIKSNISYLILNEILNKFSNSIYTGWTTNSINSYIYNYQDRLNFFYPLEKRIIIDKFDIDLPSFNFAININLKDEFINYLNEKNLGYEIIASDLKRIIIKIFAKDFNNLIIFKKIIKYFNPDITIGIGDSIENLSFINLCDEKIAMLNSNLAAKLKKTTKYDNDHNGCLRFLLNQ